MPRSEPITKSMDDQLWARDEGCVAPRLGIETPCGNAWGVGQVVIERDHIHPTGVGMKGRAILSNLVLLCGFHHRLKTEGGRTWRPLLDAYVASQS